MKKVFVLTILLVLLMPVFLFVGYYETSWAEDNALVFFIKRKPTFKIAFGNFFATDSDGKKLQNLTEQQRRMIIDYCKYHLGIEIEMKTQAEMDRCEQGFYETLKKSTER
ncbi:hypothetical protein [Pseudomonas syringae]|uniref:hypothetical protein n=1 Tax=Pseudomonas syringae TaxID=317 RepID=UPI00067A8852|nr:hypothetical protein [Pseudomonas syringae]